VVSDAREHMAKAVDHAQAEFGSIRTGRATPALVERAPEYQAALEAALNFTKPQFNESMRSGHANM